ncbi:gpW family protein [Dyella lutea]|uniref:GpW family protein n=1 Tax=Dyella lutea TaxID=2950441 RepID=A0ABT1FF80_9GAMM|nr:gpW family protein [Dyella lutea]MCP1376035.1 gpW family protein [Dyella lutea]
MRYANPYNPATSLLAGMPTAQLQQALAAAQQAYIDLSTGAKGESYSYTQGDGSKSVTYTRANLPALQNLIQTLQAQLGIVCRPRQPVRPVFW